MYKPYNFGKGNSPGNSVRGGNVQGNMSMGNVRLPLKLTAANPATRQIPHRCTPD